VCCLGVFGLRPALGLAAKVAIEERGTAALGVPVAIHDAWVEFSPWRLQLAGLSVASPPGFEQDLARAKEFLVDIDLGRSCCGGRHYELQTVSLRNLQVSICEREDGLTNFRNIFERLEHLRDGLDAGGGGRILQPQQADNGFLARRGTESVTLVVGRLNLTEITLYLHAPAFSESNGAVSYNVRQLLVDHIGEEGKGVTPREFSLIVLQALLKAALNDLPRNVVDKLPRGVAQLASTALGVTGAVSADMGKGLVEVGDLLRGAGPRAAPPLASLESFLEQDVPKFPLPCPA